MKKMMKLNSELRVSEWLENDGDLCQNLSFRTHCSTLRTVCAIG
jgi:hypothetical protein